MEAGCGPGANLAMLAEFGDVHAFEPDATSAEHAARTSGLEVRRGSLPWAVPFDGEFDLIGVFDVIEHIEDDLGALTALHSLNRVGGFTVVTVPAFPSLWSSHDEVNHHWRRYTKGSLARVLEAAGYEVTFISHYNFWLFPLAVVARQIERLLRLRRPTNIDTPSSALVNGTLLRIFRSERHLLRRFPLPVGLSLLAVCRKPQPHNASSAVTSG